MNRTHTHDVPSIAILQARADALRAIRAFFDERGYLEVETPNLRRFASMEPHLHSFATTVEAPGVSDVEMFLHTSPEYAMKQVVAQVQASIYQVTKVFRNGEASATHLPEFTMLEWYGVDDTYREAMILTERLVRAVARAVLERLGGEEARETLEIVEGPFVALTIAEAWRMWVGFDPTNMSAPELRKAARNTGFACGNDWPWEDVFHYVMLERIEIELEKCGPAFLYDFPARLSSLAEVRGDVSERFELYWRGAELCNGFSELRDPQEQRARFIDERAQRASLGVRDLEIDEGLIEALSTLPRCAGNAVGIDRLLMVVLDKSNLRQVTIA